MLNMSITNSVLEKEFYLFVTQPLYRETAEPQKPVNSQRPGSEIVNRESPKTATHRFRSVTAKHDIRSDLNLVTSTVHEDFFHLPILER